MRNREAIAREFLEQYGYVTNAMFAEVGLTHTGRNAVGEAKDYFIGKGYRIEFKRSRDFLKNKWSLVPLQQMEITIDQNGQRAFA